MGQRSKLNIALIKYLDLINIVEIKYRHGNQTELDRLEWNFESTTTQHVAKYHWIVKLYCFNNFLIELSLDSSEEITNLVNKTAIEFEKRTIIIQKLSENVSETMSSLKEFKKEQNQKIQGIGFETNCLFGNIIWYNCIFITRIDD